MKRLFIVISLAVVFMVAAFSVKSQELTYTESTLWSGMLDVKISGNISYCAMQNGLLLLDITDPTNPLFLSKIYLPEGPPTDMRLVGDLVYLTEKKVLYIIDVSNPAAPTIAGSYGLPNASYGIDVSGNLAYVVYGYLSDDPKGLLILDISNPQKIYEVETVATDFVPLKVRVRGNYAYLVGGARVCIIDISTNPSSFVSQFYTGFFPINLDLNGDSLVYLAELDVFWPPLTSAFTILNVSDPENPEIIGRQNLNIAVTDVVLSDDLAYISNGFYGVQIFDVSDPANPNIIGHYHVAGFPGNMDVMDSLLFVVDHRNVSVSKSSTPATDSLLSLVDSLLSLVDYSKESDFIISLLGNSAAEPGDLQIISVSDPAAPELIGLYKLPGSVTSVTASGAYIYALNSEDDGDDIVVLDVLNRNNPQIVGSYFTTGSAQKAVIVDTLLFLAAGSGGLEIINISDPGNLYLIGSNTGGSGALDVVVAGNYAYIANSSSGVWIFDISDPANPTYAGSYNTPDLAIGIELYNGYVYVADRESGMQILNVSDPKNPSYVNSFGVSRYAYQGVEISGRYLYAESAGAFHIFDLADPENPVFVEGFQTGANLYEILKVEDYVVLANGGWGVRIVDVSDPSYPTETFLYNTPGVARSVFLDGMYLYVADRNSLIILERQFSTDINEDDDILPETFVLRQNYPNPFNPTTTIQYELPRKSHVRLTVYNILGQEIAILLDEIKSAGVYEIKWNATNFPSGVYLYKMETEETIAVNKMLLLK